jgi:hypothetical protein
MHALPAFLIPPIVHGAPTVQQGNPFTGCRLIASDNEALLQPADTRSVIQLLSWGFDSPHDAGHSIGRVGYKHLIHLVDCEFPQSPDVVRAFRL